MENPQIGQRWLVDTDASLGLGIVIDCGARQLTLEFPATGESRRYSRHNAPLTRASFEQGDTIKTINGDQYIVDRVEEINGLLIYLNADGDPIPESQLAANIQFNHPLKRLLAGQLDKPDWFTVREQLAQGYQQWRRSQCVGLVGARIQLNAHQLYVAHSATSRFPVRVLLADEVGLGKTIEAGLILQRLQHQELVKRTLIVVPEALCVQWFVELLRCFSIHSVLVDEETDLNDSRVFIVSHQFFEGDKAQQVDPWDMVIVDEAHHFDLLEPNQAAINLSKIAQQSTHLLLVSATPERLGLQSHFARLQLLDSEKFFNFDDFQQSFECYQALAEDLQALWLETSSEVSASLRERLESHFDIRINPQMNKSDLTELLLDSEGTGRVVYRNTRQAIAGFPHRQLVIHDIANQEEKVAWLIDFIKAYRNEKLLLITHKKEDVLELRESLYRKTGVDCPVFHEDMSLIERDRAAAYFADSEEGAPLLLCSEIGSEGRNFQFCHRLICWDLPDHPDVLEQRIGRLDRIGQTHNIEIHICVISSDDRQRLHWFHDLLSCIERINPAAGAIHDRWYMQYLENPSAVEATVVTEVDQLLSTLEEGRDLLLEINSCRQPDADQLVETVKNYEQEHNPQDLLEKLTDVLNLHYEQLSDTRFQLVPSDQMLVPFIPGIPSEGCELTYDRDTAIAREDIAFITWDHPVMQGLSDLIGQSELGVASVGILPSKKLRPGMLFVEVLFSLSIQSSNTPQIERYLTNSGVRVVVTIDNTKNLAKALPSEQLEQLLTAAPKAVEKTLVKQMSAQINQLVDVAQGHAESETKRILDESLKQLKERSSLEQSRLEQLQHHNSSITGDDIQAVKTHYQNIVETLTKFCQPSLSAIRLILTNKDEH